MGDSDPLRESKHESATGERKDMALSREDAVGRPTGAATVHIERGPVSQFARAVKDNSGAMETDTLGGEKNADGHRPTS